MKIETRKFSAIPFVVPTEKRMRNKLDKLLDEIKECGSALTASTAIKHWNKYMDELQTQFQVISILYSLNTNSKVYKKAQQTADELSPIVSDYQNKYSKVLAKARYRKDLEQKFGKYYFAKIDANLKVFDEKIVPDLIEQNKLTSKYFEILGGAKIPFRDGIYNLSQIGKFTQDLDRDIRKEAAKAFDKWIGDNNAELGCLYTKLVLLRDGMAKKLGFKNFVDLGYLRLGRIDYNKNDVKKYRDQIYDKVVPVCQNLYKKQIKNLGIKNPQYYDYSVSFKSGNPIPAGDEKYLVNAAKKMYHGLSKESGEFFDFMIKNELMDLSAKEGKQPGGYTTYLPDYKAPFIFSNFNGTAGDVDVLTHEGGHAFQAYLASDIKIPQYRDPGYEACEIHSMSMEFFAYAYAKDFFGNDADKYLYTHMCNSIEFLPYGVCVDEFQHWVYEHPTASHDERCAYWRNLELKYNPEKIYNDCPNLNKGTYWLRQLHIFSDPFYYIDYTLAGMVAFQIFNENQKNHDKAWKKYLKYTKFAGKYPFLELLEKAHLRSPFDDGTVDKAINGCVKFLKTFDISKF